MKFQHLNHIQTPPLMANMPLTMPLMAKMPLSIPLMALLVVIFLFAASCRPAQEPASVADTIREAIVASERTKVLDSARAYLSAEPITVTASSSPRSAGGLQDYFSEGTYWWPDPANPGGPYIRRDGIVNPENFNDHLDAMKRLSSIVGTLTSAWLLTGDAAYAEHAMRHLNAWFVNPDTRMNPHLRYAQAISGIVTGRGIGIIDTVHLIDVAQAAMLLSESPHANPDHIAEIRAWFRAYTEWLRTHPYGIEEMNWRNNHGTWWHTQVASFASLTGDEALLDTLAVRTRTILIPNQTAENGSYPLELERTRPYAYSYFNLNGMTLLAHILSREGHDLWNFSLADGRGVGLSIAYMKYYTRNKHEWPLAPDVDYWDEFPGTQPFLPLAALGYENLGYLRTWQEIPPVALSHEGLRNLPVKNILLWIGLPVPG